MEGKAVHDLLLENLPDGVTHHMAGCPHCLEDAEDQGEQSGGTTVTTFTQEDLDRAVAAAAAERDAKIHALEAAAATATVEAKVSEAVTAKEAELAAVQAKLDGAELALEAEKAKFTAMEAALADEAAKAEQAKLVESRKDARKAEVSALALPFTAAQIDEKVGRWAAMSDEDWKTQLDDFAEIAKATGVSPIRTLSGGRETDALSTRSGGGSSTAAAVVGAIRQLTDAGIDPRQIH